MTQPQTMTVEQTEILGRATEVEQALPTLPNITPMKPCGFKAADTAARQLVLSSNNMLNYLQAGHQEWTRLATSMRNAAKAYGEVDETGAAAMTSGGTVSDASQMLSAGDTGPTALSDTQTATAGGPDFTDLKAAARQVAEPDQSTSFAAFADQWMDYNLTLQGIVTRFRGFQNWEGEAAAAVTASMDQQNQWVGFMAQLSASMAKQARYVAELHKWAVAQHPTLAQVEGLERAYAQATSDGVRQELMKQYKAYQDTSTQVLSDYNTKASLDPINPPKPPAAVKIDTPPPQGLIPSQIMSALTGGGSGQMPQMPQMPQMGSGGSGGGSPAGGAGATLTGAAHHEAPKMPGGGAGGMKPMSLGGGGAGGGGPLAPAVEAGAVAPAATTDAAGAGRGAAAGSGAAGGGMGGMPMGGAHGAGGSSKSKTSQQDDEALYKEDRAWTEAVIGNRRSPTGKESK